MHSQRMKVERVEIDKTRHHFVCLLKFITVLIGPKLSLQIRKTNVYEITRFEKFIVVVVNKTYQLAIGKKFKLVTPRTQKLP